MLKTANMPADYPRDISFADGREHVLVMAHHYIVAAVWADAPEGTHPRATLATWKKAYADCLAFLESLPAGIVAEIPEEYGAHPDCGNRHPIYAAMGHDLWLTRTGAGVGFWDRDALEGEWAGSTVGDTLTKHADSMGDPNAEFYRGWLYL